MDWALAPLFARQVREGHAVAQNDLFGPSVQLAGAGVAAAGRPRLPLRLMAGLLYLKHAYLSQTRNWWSAGPRTSSGSTSAACASTSHACPATLRRSGARSAIGEAGFEELLKATIDPAVTSQAIKPAKFERLIVDTTVQEKAIVHPVDSRLLGIARHKVVAAVRRAGIVLKQTFVKEGEILRRKVGGHAKQFKRLRKVVKRQRTILGIVLREVQRKIAQASEASALTLINLQTLMQRAELIRSQHPKDKNKLHAPEVECIGKGKARKPYEFGVKVSVAVTHKQGLMV